MLTIPVFVEHDIIIMAHNPERLSQLSNEPVFNNI